MGGPGASSENILSGDLARLLGIHGRTVKVGENEILLVYLLVAGIAGLLFLSGNTEILRMGMFLFLGYMMYKMVMANNPGMGGTTGNMGGFFGGGSGGSGGTSGGGGGSGGGGSGPGGDSGGGGGNSKFPGGDSRAGGGAYRLGG